ncbi:MAG: hypothetical protein PHD61_03545 [Bacteroidales bacterium]|nr:hypothetical protein [Lentimicrobiaceae bacterium]MDD5694360.1 hypothetical protein [Bacteroidales bacterium]
MTKRIGSLTVMMHNYGIDDFQDNELHVETYPYTRSVFDDQGNAVEEITFTKEGETESRYVRKYDAQGILTEELYYSGEDLTDRRTFERRSDGKLIREYRHYLDGSLDTISYLYNDQDQLSEKVTRDDEDFLESRTLFEYMDSRLVAEKETDGEGELISEKKVVYNDAGHPVEQMEWTRENDYRMRLAEELDEQGMRIRSARYINGRLVERMGYQHDEKGQVLQMTEENERGSSIYTFEYDALGNMTLQEEQDREGRVISRIERTYDGEGRILENKVFIDGQGRRMSQHYRLEYIYTFNG